MLIVIEMMDWERTGVGLGVWNRILLEGSSIDSMKC